MVGTRWEGWPDMDSVAHGWWKGVGLAAAPDLLHLLPVALGELQRAGGLGTVRDHALALPGGDSP